MEKFEIAKQCNNYIGLKFKAAPGSETPEMKFEIVKQGIEDNNGFPAVELLFKDGEKEIAAIDCIENGVKNRGLIVL